MAAAQRKLDRSEDTVLRGDRGRCPLKPPPGTPRFLGFPHIASRLRLNLSKLKKEKEKSNMKKLTMLLLAAALTLCPLFALAAQETISVYNWGDYIEPEVLDPVRAGDRPQGHL